MDLLGILILIGAIALVAFTIIFNVVRRVKGKSCCSCAPVKKQDGSVAETHGCDGCCSHCRGCDHSDRQAR